MGERPVCKVALFGPGPVCKPCRDRLSLRPMHFRILTFLGIGAAEPTAEITRERLYEELWPKLDDPANTCSRHLSEIRSALNCCGVSGEPIDTVGKTIRLNPFAVEVDAARMMRSYKEAVDALSLEERRASLEAAFTYSQGSLVKVDIKDPKISNVYKRIQIVQGQIRYELALCIESQGDIEKALEYAGLSCELAPDDLNFQELKLRLTDRVIARTRPQRPLDPKLTSFVGREAEIRTIHRKLRLNRLVTLTGAGGSGKTRLALRVAHSVAEEYREGACLVKLAPFSEPEQVTQAIMSAIGMRGTVSSTPDDIAVFLDNKDILLVLDNCEHLLQACADVVSTILIGCQNAKILATSRFDLGIEGENLVPIPPMSMDDASNMFRERAEAVGVTISDADAQDVVNICRRLDGLPLAIELTAPLCIPLSIQHIREKLDDSFDLLNNNNARGQEERHQTVDTVIRWSYDLLSTEERTLFHRLAVFIGGWTLEAATEVCISREIEESEVLPLLDRLLRKSFITRRDQDGMSRYYMLELIREYGLVQLQKSGEEGQIRSRHLGFVVGVASRVSANLRGPEQMRQFDIFDAEYPNIFMAVERCFGNLGNKEDGADLGKTSPLELAATLLSTLSRFIGARENYGQARKVYEAVLSRRGALPVTLTWASVYHEAGGFARMQGDYGQARYLYLEGLRIRDRFRDSQGVASSLACIGLAYADENRHEESVPYYQSALEINRQRRPGSLYYFAVCLNGLGSAALRRGDLADAAQHFGQAMEAMKKIKDGQGIAMAYYSLANLAYAKGDAADAYRCFLASLAIERRIGDRPRIAEILEGFAVLATDRTDAESVASLYFLAGGLREYSGKPVPRKDEQRIARITEAINNAMDPAKIARMRVNTDRGTLDRELDRWCDELKQGHSDVWADALKNLDLTDEQASRQPSAVHLFDSIDRFLGTHGASDRPSGVAPALDSISPDVFVELGRSALERGDSDLSAQYYLISRALDRVKEGEGTESSMDLRTGADRHIAPA